jgi:LCP family protein required for cell wall assembly
MKALSARTFLHRTVTAFVIAVVVTVVAIAGAYAAAARKVSKVARAPIDPSVLQSGGNYLLIGSDTRAFVDNAADAQHFGSADTQTGQRSDTIMVAHVEPDGRALLVSFPRDLWVEIPGIGHAKINAAFNAGPQRLIETIENDFDVPVSHYLEIDFAGFRDLVDELGSIPIYFPAPARDAKSGLSVPNAGCRQLNGDQALAYVRSRYYESFVNGQWRSDPTSDLGRIQRQQYFLRTVAQQTLHAAERSPWKATSLLDTVLRDVSRDPKLGLSGLRALAYAFHEPGGVETATLPVNRQFFDGQDALALDTAKAAPLLARLRGIGDASSAGTSSTSGVAPGSVHVAVENGSGRNGLGAQAVGSLGDLGFPVVGAASNADRGDYAVTEVRYAAGAEAKAQLLLAHLQGAGKAVPLAGPAPGGADVVLVLGRDYHGLARSAATTPSTKPAQGSPTTRSATTGGTAGAAEANTSTLPAAGC